MIVGVAQWLEAQNDSPILVLVNVRRVYIPVEDEVPGSNPGPNTLC